MRVKQNNIEQDFHLTEIVCSLNDYFETSRSQSRIQF